MWAPISSFIHTFAGIEDHFWSSAIPPITLAGPQLGSYMNSLFTKAFQKQWQTRVESCDRWAAACLHDTTTWNDAQSRSLPLLKCYNIVWVQDQVTKLWDKISKVMGIGKTCEYLLQMPGRQVFWRNCHFIRSASPPFGNSQTMDGPHPPTAPRCSQGIVAREDAQDMTCYEHKGGREMY